MILYRCLIFLCLCSFLGCVKADRGQSVQRSSYSFTANLSDFNNRALFQAGEIVLDEWFFSHTGKSDWMGVDHIDLWFLLCDIRDRASQGVLNGQLFNIQSRELGEKTIWSNQGDRAELSNPVQVAGDCLKWKQEVPVFDFFGKSVNLAIHYEIESVAGNMGKIVRRIKLNPWDIHRNGRESKRGGFQDITVLDKKRGQWPRGEWVMGEKNIISALKGELYPTDAAVQMKNLEILPVQREQQPDLPITKSLGNEEMQLRQKLDDEIKLRKRIENDVLKRAGINMTINIAAQPFVRMGNSTGVISERNSEIGLSTGRFQVFANLVASGASGGKEKYLLSDDISKVIGENTGFTWAVDENGLQVSVPLILKHRSNLGGIELVIKVVPVSPGLNKLKPFTGVYDLGEWDNWVRKQNPQFKREVYEPINEIDYDHYIDSLYILGGVLNKRGEASVTVGEYKNKYIRTVETASQFILNPFTPRFVRFMPGETATERTLQYMVEGCFINGLTRRPVGAGLQFDVQTDDEYGGRHTVRRETNNRGCITWFGFLSHQYYRKEVLKEKKAKITYAGTFVCSPINDGKLPEGCEVQNQGHIRFIEEYTYYMNPWDEKWTFGWDARNMPANYARQIEEQRKTAPDSKIFIPEFKYETMGFRYSVDKFLNLKVKKTVLFSFHPYALKYNSIVKGRGATEKLRDGVYLMKVALQKDYLDPSARGVLIYDKKLSPSPFKLIHDSADCFENVGDEALASLGSNFVSIDVEEIEKAHETLKNLKLFDAIKMDAQISQYGINLVEIRGNASKPIAIVVEDVDKNCHLKGYSLKFYKNKKGENYSAARIYKDDNQVPYLVGEGEPLPNELRSLSRKQFITVQQKLVKVIGGRVITPVEFEVNDLRLMRIRNQLFLQLETIDERKLKLAATFDERLQAQNGKFNFEEKYREIYGMIDDLGLPMEDTLKDNSVVKKVIDGLFGRKSVGMYREEELKEAKRKIYGIFGLREEDWNNEELRQKVKERILRVFNYKSLGLNERDAFDNDKRILISNVMEANTRTNAEAMINGLLEKYRTRLAERDEDPFRQQRGNMLDEMDMSDQSQSFMLPMGRNATDILKNILENELENSSGDGRDDILSSIEDNLENVDFTTIPLTPNFSLDFLSNEGPSPEPVYDEYGNKLPDNGASGLPSRTFVGPLTFILNRNNSHLRPTDVLNERSCATSSCSVPEKIEDVYFNSRVNMNYENNKYYGFLGAYYNMSVDDFIEMKKDIDEKQVREMEMGSQIIHFVRRMKLKYTSIRNDDSRLGLREVNWNECKEKDIRSLEECYTPVKSGPELHDKQTFYRQLNDRYYTEHLLNSFTDSLSDDKLKNIIESNPESFFNRIEGGTNEKYYFLEEGGFNDDDIDEIISLHPGERGYNFKKNKNFMHRMCFVLTQNLFNRDYFNDEVMKQKRFEKQWEGDHIYSPDVLPPQTLRENMTATRKFFKDVTTLNKIEKKCHEFIGNLYNYPEDWFGNVDFDSFGEDDQWSYPNHHLVKYSPIVLERKVRVFRTTGRYIYRGGKSLNVNVSASFNISALNSMSSSTRSSWKPYSWFSDAIVSLGAGLAVGAGIGGAAGAGVGAAPGAVIGGGIALVGSIFRIFLGGFDVSRSTARDEKIGSKDGTTVSSGTFLVAQQSTLDVELGDYEKCLVARFHPAFLKYILNKRDDFLKPNFVDTDDKTSFESFGMMICSGKRENKCLPVKERYFYFTQHFTDGDMQDVGDLHNHPWLLQLRGIRDFVTFTSLVGAREVETDNNDWFSQTGWANISDATSFKLSGSAEENKTQRFQYVSRDSDINWTLNELSRVYFNSLPTFPSLYTIYEDIPQYPWKNPEADHLIEYTYSNHLGCHQ